MQSVDKFKQMNTQEFIELVKSHTAPSLQSLIAAVVDMLGEELRFERSEVANVIEAAGRLATYLETIGVAKGQQEQGEVSAKPTVTREFLSDLITPWIQDIRQEIFNTRVCPFGTYEEALRWVNEGIVDWENWVNEAEREMEKLPKWMRSSGYVSPRFAPELHRLLGKRPLYALFSDRVKEVTRVTGFSHISVLCHIIADIPLTLKKVDTEAKREIHELPSGDELVNRFVTVQIRGELTFGELYRLYQQIRQDLGIKRSKALKDEHLRLYQLVRGRGGPIKGKGSVKFWKEVVENWNNPKCKNWKGAKIAYDRLIKRLTNEYLQGGKRR